MHRRCCLESPGRRRRLHFDSGRRGRREDSSWPVRPSFFQPSLGRRRPFARARSLQAASNPRPRVETRRGHRRCARDERDRLRARPARKHGDLRERRGLRQSPMSDDATPERGFIAEFPLAISFLTILPVIDRRPASEETVAASFAWFPIVGLLIGVALVGEDWLLAFFFAQVIRSVLIVISLTVITGAVHLDGLADTADALGAGRDRERALDILHDSRVGTFGASAIFFDLTLKILALSTLAGYHRY